MKNLLLSSAFVYLSLVACAAETVSTHSAKPATVVPAVPVVPAKAPAKPVAAKPAKPAAPVRSRFDAFLAAHYKALPLERDERGSRFFLPVTINGVRARLHVDTGCNNTNIYAHAITRFGMKATPTQKVMMGLGGLEKLSVASYATIDLGGGLVRSNGTVDISSGAGVDDCDGILGTDWLDGQGVLLSIEHHCLYVPVSGRGVSEAVAAAAATAGFMRTQLKNLNGVRAFDASINGTHAQLLFDTGAQQLLIDSAVAKAAGLKVSDVDAGGVGTGGQEARLGYACPEIIALGDVQLRGLACMVADLSMLKRQGLDGLMGGELLTRLHAILDIDSSMLYLDGGRDIQLCDIGVFPGDFPKGVAPEALLKDSPTVFGGLIRPGAKRIGEITATDGTPAYVVYELSCLVRQVIKDETGKVKRGDTVAFPVLLESGPDMQKRLQAQMVHMAAPIVRMPKSSENKDARTIPDTLVPGSPLRIDRLLKIQADAQKAADKKAAAQKKAAAAEATPVEAKQ